MILVYTTAFTFKGDLKLLWSPKRTTYFRRMSNNKKKQPGHLIKPTNRDII